MKTPMQELIKQMSYNRDRALGAEKDAYNICILYAENMLEKLETLKTNNKMKRTLIIYNTRETTQEEATHLLDILNCDDSMLWDNADRCGVEIIEVPTDKTKNEMKTKTEMEHKNPLTNPAEHTLQELFAELKFGRPSASQNYLDKCIAELNEQEA